MLEGVGSGDMLQLLMRVETEGATAASEQDLVHLVSVLSYQALEDGTVLRVDRQEADMVFCH